MSNESTPPTPIADALQVLTREAQRWEGLAKQTRSELNSAYRELDERRASQPSDRGILDFETIAQFTGQRHLHGKEGRAPTIPEMIQALQGSLDETLRLRGQEDLQGLGIESMVASLCCRLQASERLLRSAARALEDAHDLSTAGDSERAALVEKIHGTVGRPQPATKGALDADG